MTAPKGKIRAAKVEPSPARAKRRYERPRLTDYGHVSKLTLTGAGSMGDAGSMQRQCL